MRCVITADAHVNTRGLRAQIPQEDTLRPIQFITKFCVQHGYPLVIAGDLFDTNNPPAHLVQHVVQALETMTSQGLQVFVIQGNHDKDKIPWACLAKGVVWANQVEFQLGSLRAFGLDYNPLHIIEQHVLKIQNRYDVIIVHQAFRQALPFEDAWNCDLDWFEGRTANVIAGDIHNVHAPFFSTSKNVRGLYPGSTYMTSVTDNPNPSFLVIDDELDERGFVPYERVVIPHRPFLKIVAQTPDDLERVFRTTVFSEKPIILLEYPVTNTAIPATVKRLCHEAYIIEKPVAPTVSERELTLCYHQTYQARQAVTLASLIQSANISDTSKLLAGDLASVNSRDEVQVRLQEFIDVYLSQVDPADSACVPAST